MAYFLPNSSIALTHFDGMPVNLDLQTIGPLTPIKNCGICGLQSVFLWRALQVFCPLLWPWRRGHVCVICIRGTRLREAPPNVCLAEVHKVLCINGGGEDSNMGH